MYGVSRAGTVTLRRPVAAALTEFEAARKIPDAAIAITRLIDELRRRVAN
jgi:hypothetical protein